MCEIFSPPSQACTFPTTIFQVSRSLSEIGSKDKLETKQKGFGPEPDPAKVWTTRFSVGAASPISIDLLKLEALPWGKQHEPAVRNNRNRREKIFHKRKAQQNRCMGTRTKGLRFSMSWTSCKTNPFDFRPSTKIHVRQLASNQRN